MQPEAARVGPSSDPSVRKIAVRFSSGATIFIEKTIKVLFLSTQSGGQLISYWQEARQLATRSVSVRISPPKQQDRKFGNQTAAAWDSAHPPRFRRLLRDLGVVWNG